MPATRIRAAAVQALQLALLVLCLLPLWPLWWAIFSIFGVLTVARGLRNTDSYPGPHWLKWPLAVVSLPLKLAAGLAWTLYAVLTLTIHPFTLLAVEILRGFASDQLGEPDWFRWRQLSTAAKRSTSRCRAAQRCYNCSKHRRSRAPPSRAWASKA